MTDDKIIDMMFEGHVITHNGVGWYLNNFIIPNKQVEGLEDDKKIIIQYPYGRLL